MNRKPPSVWDELKHDVKGAWRELWHDGFWPAFWLFIAGWVIYFFIALWMAM